MPPLELQDVRAIRSAVGESFVGDASEQIEIRIDGRSISARPGQLLPDGLAGSDIHLPYLCYHPSLGPIQSCDICFVEAGGNPGPGCSVAVQPRLDVTIDSERAHAARREDIDRVTANHDLYCSVCDNNGHCDLHDAVRDPSEIMAKSVALTRLMSGVSYERLKGFASLQWPVCKDGEDTQPALCRTGPPRPGARPEAEV